MTFHSSYSTFTPKLRVITRRLLFNKPPRPLLLPSAFAHQREVRMKGGFYVSLEAKLLFVIRVRG